MAYKVFSNGDALTGGELNTYLMNQSVMVFASTTARNAALPAPTEGMLVWLEDLNKYTYYSGTAWTDLITPASTGNAIINGAFEIWQRGTSFTQAYFPSGATYVADRYTIVYNAIPTAVTISQQTFTPGTAPVSGYEGSFFYRSAITTVGSTTVWGTSQRIEDVRTFAGQTATFSFWAKADSVRNVTPEIIQNFGSGGSGDVTVSATAIALTTSWARYSVTVSVPSISGKTIGTNSSLRVTFLQAAASGSTLDLWGVQFEAGSTATAFKRNGTSQSAELSACERYYRTGTLNFRQYSPTGSSNAYFVSTSLIAGMRTTPTPAFIAAAAASLNITGTPTLVMYDGTSLQQTLNATNTGDCYYVRRFELSAEL